MYVERHPMVRRLSALLKIHERRVAGAGCAEAEWTSDPLADLNTLQHELEQLNVSLGYFVEPELREEYGNISREGRYRLWKEVWMLNYFGRPFSY
jgi:predicted GNAT superfamily acetyltransferase